MINSVIQQTYTNWELLITDDCSVDTSQDIIKEMADLDCRIKLFILDKNSGAGSARNKSIANAKGRYIAFLDADDIWAYDKLELQLKFLKENNYSFVHSYTQVIDENGKLLGINRKPYKVTYTSTKIINYIGTSSVIYDTKDIGKFYMPNIRKRQDWALWLLILKKVKNAYCYPKPLFYYRCTPNSISSNKMGLYKYHIIVYNQCLKYSLIKSYLFFYCISLPCIFLKKFKEIIVKF